MQGELGDKLGTVSWPECDRCGSLDPSYPDCACYNQQHGWSTQPERGKGRFVEQIYGTLLFGVPMVILSYLLSLIPGVGSWLAYVPHIYSLVLIVLAMIAVHWRVQAGAEQPAGRFVGE